MGDTLKQCPNCGEYVEFGKQKLVNCYKCGACLIIVKIGKKFVIDDVTPPNKRKKVINNNG